MLPTPNPVGSGGANSGARELGLYRDPDEISNEELLALAAETNGDLDLMAERLQQARRGLELRLAKLKRRGLDVSVKSKS